jgi:hypothetical protein
MILTSSALKLVAIVCTIAFWAGFFLMVDIGAKAGPGHPLDRHRLFAIAGGAVIAYVASFLIKRYLGKRGVPASELKDLD